MSVTAEHSPLAGGAASATVTDGHIGQVIGDTYRVVRRIGAGASSHVYQVEHLRLGRLLALKLWREAPSSHGSTAHRFRREARALAVIRNEHVVTVCDCGEHGGAPYLVTEWCEGEDLRHLLEREGRLTARRAMNIVAQAAQGVRSLHAAGLVHRDIKPENLFICRRCTGEDWCKLLDLGVVKGVSSWSTTAGAIVGTVRYMAPEQLTDSGSVGVEADVYALGAVLYECLTGAPPHDATTVQRLMFQVLNEAPSSLRQRCPQLPRHVCDVVMACLSKKASSRPSMVDLGDIMGRELDAPVVHLPLAPWPTRLRLSDAARTGTARAGSWQDSSGPRCWER